MKKYIYIYIYILFGLPLKEKREIEAHGVDSSSLYAGLANLHLQIILF